jgi:transcriptional regulator GlxA family with amidase domain
MPQPIVSVVLFEGISSFHLSVPGLIFGQDRTALGLPRFDLRFFACEGRTVRSDLGFSVACSDDPATVAAADIVVVPSWDLSQRVPEALTAALRAAHAKGAILAGLCLGAFPMAASGLLNGRRATTHWAFAERLGMAFPSVEVDPKVLYVGADGIYTSAGVAAGLDCCVHILRELYGSERANALARHIVMSPQRLGGQAQLIDMPVPKSNDRFATVLDRLRQTLDQPHTLDSVAAEAAMNRRTFTRRFLASQGMTFAEWLARERSLHARHLLETTRLSVEEVARRSGFATTATLRAHFARHFRISPLLHRRSFGQAVGDRH